MTDVIVHLLQVLVQLLEICGATVLILGFSVATWKWAQRVRQDAHRSALGSYRQALGRSVLAGLEVLVAATIIKTIIIEPSYESLGLLAGMIIIRTILGWTTFVEISGRWQWQKVPASPTKP